MPTENNISKPASGHGVFVVANGDVYEGDFENGVREGQGIETFHTGERYVGSYVGDLRNGQGIAYYDNGNVKYMGRWVEGRPDGNGTYVALNGDRLGPSVDQDRLKWGSWNEGHLLENCRCHIPPNIVILC